MLTREQRERKESRKKGKYERKGLEESEFIFVPVMFGCGLQRHGHGTAFVESLAVGASWSVSRCNSGADYWPGRGACRLRPRRRGIDVSLMGRRSRRTAMRMNANEDSEPGHAAIPNDSQAKDEESEGAREINSEEVKEEVNEDTTPKTPSSTEVLFNQEVLRRRMSALNSKPRSVESNDNSVLDLSVVSDQDFTGEISEETLSDADATEFLSTFDNLKCIWVILFTNSNDGTEGVYSLSIGDQSIVLAFQERQEAHRYAICLEAQKFPQPQICEMDPKEIREFCVDAKLKLGFIPSGMIITPPDESIIEDLDKWGGKSSRESGSTKMSDDDIDAMRKRFDTLFGQ